MTDDAWSNFIASIDPVALERERMRVHGDLMAERFGSRQHWEMVHAHEWLSAQRHGTEHVAELIHEHQTGLRQLADAETAIRLHLTTEDEEIEASIAAYRARKKAA